MGWTCYRKPANVKAELDGLLTWSDANGVRRVLDSGIVNFHTYYAAVEHTKPTGERIVFAAVTLLQFTHGEFCRKDLDETCGPTERECPERILDLLTPTDSEFALQWRWDCRAFHARKADNKVVDGATVKLNGSWVGTDTFIAHKVRGGWRFQPVNGLGAYKLRGWRSRIVAVTPPDGTKAAKASALAKLGPRPKTSQELWDEAHADDFVVTSAWGRWAAWVPEGKTGVCARRRSDGAEQWALVDADAYEKRYENADPGVRGFYILDSTRDCFINKPENEHATKQVVAA
jgi:hypothetical protein